MPRPRIVRVEFKLCPSSVYHLVVHAFQGESCTLCGRLFDPTTMFCDARDRMIVADNDPPEYERVLRARCRHCRTLFAVSPEQAALCGHCGGTILSEEALKALWTRRDANATEPARERDALFTRTRDIAWFINVVWEQPSRRTAIVLRELTRCNVGFTATAPLRPLCQSCGAPLPRISLCPLCATEDDATGCLPQNPTYVWRRVVGGGYETSKVGFDWDGGAGPQPVVIVQPPGR